PVFACHGAFRLEIGKQRKVQLAIFGVGDVAPALVDGDGQKLGGVLIELGEDSVVEAELIAADWAPVGRIEGEDHRPAAELGQVNTLVGRGGELESRCRGSRRQCAGRLLIISQTCWSIAVAARVVALMAVSAARWIAALSSGRHEYLRVISVSGFTPSQGSRGRVPRCASRSGAAWPPARSSGCPSRWSRRRSRG